MAESDHGPRLGADPELFVQTAEGRIVPVCGKVGGTKENPLIIDHLVAAQFGHERDRRDRPIGNQEGHYAVQEDNVMLEFNVPAYKGSESFVNSIDKALQILDANVLRIQGLQIKFGAVMHTFRPEELAAYPQALTIGCLPDMNAYAEGGLFERQPFSATHFGNHRFCGGHLHVQYNHNNVPRHIFAQFMDVVAELPFLRWDKQKMRRMFYGQPGLYRDKPYGIEYRTPSNFWLNRPFREKWLHIMVENIFSLARDANISPDLLKDYYQKIDWNEVQHAIKTEDAKLADELVEYIRHKVGLNIHAAATR